MPGSTVQGEELVNFVTGCARTGHPRTRKQVLAIVQQYLLKKGQFVIVSGKDSERGTEKISLRTAAALSQVRPIPMDRDTCTLDHYYQVLENALKENI